MKRGVLACLLAMALTLSACSGAGSEPISSGSNSGNSSDISQGAAVGNDDGEKVVLDFMHFHTPETADSNIENEAFHVMLEKYRTEHPDYTINESSLHTSDYHTKVMALAAANEMPDVFFTKGSWVQNFYDNGLMADLSGSLNLDDYRDGIFIPFTRDGKIYASPFQFSITSLVYYNEPMWKEIGYDSFPATWNELVEADAKFKEKGIPTFALGNKDKWPYESCIISTLGDRFTGTDWTQSIILGDGKAKFTDPEFITTLEFSKQMAGMFNPDFNAINNEQGMNLYGTGKTAANINGFWMITYLLQNADEEVLANTKLAILPTVEGQKGDFNAVSGGAGWAQSVSSKLTGKNLEAAIELVVQTTGVENCQYLMEKTGILGVCEVPVKDKESLPQISQIYLDYVGDLKLVPIYDIQMDGAVIDVMNSKLQELLGGTAEPQAVAEAIQAEQDKLAV